MQDHNTPSNEVQRPIFRLIRSIYADDTLERGEVAVMLALAWHADRNGVCWPSVETLARECRFSERHVQRIIAELINAGKIIAADRKGGTHSTIYTIVGYRGDIGDNGGVTFETGRGDIGDNRGDIGDNRGDIGDTKNVSNVTRTDHELPIRTTNQNNQSTTGDDADFSDFSFPAKARTSTLSQDILVAWSLRWEPNDQAIADLEKAVETHGQNAVLEAVHVLTARENVKHPMRYLQTILANPQTQRAAKPDYNAAKWVFDSIPDYTKDNDNDNGNGNGRAPGEYPHKNGVLVVEANGNQYVRVNYGKALEGTDDVL